MKQPLQRFLVSFVVFCYIAGLSYAETEAALSGEEFGVSNQQDFLSADDGDECVPYDYPNEEQCAFINGEITGDEPCEDYVNDEGPLVEYLSFYFCARIDLRPLWAIILVLWMIYLFICIGTLAESFFAPLMAQVAKLLKLSDNVAGVTFVAVGTAADDIFASYAAFTGPPGQNALGFGFVYGAVVVISIVVFGAICFVSPDTRVTRRPFVRDALFLLIASLGVWGFITTGEIRIYGAFLLVGIYITYVITVIVARIIYQSWKKKGIKTPIIDYRRIGDEPGDMVAGTAVNYDDDPLIQRDQLSDAGLSRDNPIHGVVDDFYPDGDEDLHEHPVFRKDSDGSIRSMVEHSLGLSKIGRVIWVLSRPIYYLARLTVPMTTKKLWDWRLAVLWPTITPSLFFIALKEYEITFGSSSVFVVPIIAGVGFLVSIYVFYVFYNENKVRGEVKPIFLGMYLPLGFVAIAFWLFVIAAELVALVATIGIIMRIPVEILGFTVVAWGNAINDAVIDITLAGLGFPLMALGSLFAAPILTVLLGVGIPMIANTLTEANPYELPSSTFLTVSAITMAIGMVGHIAVISLNKWKLPKFYGLWCLFLYTVFLVVNILIATDVILT